VWSSGADHLRGLVMLPDDLSPLLCLPTTHLEEQLEADQRALRKFLERRYLPDSDIAQEWIDDLRVLITAIEIELRKRKKGSSAPKPRWVIVNRSARVEAHIFLIW